MQYIRTVFRSLIVTVKKVPVPAFVGRMNVVSRFIPAGKMPGKNKIRLWLWGFAAYAMLLMLMMLLIKISLSGKSLSEHALESGQRVVIHVATGTLDGKPSGTSSTTSPATAPAEPAPSAETTTPSLPEAHLHGKEGLADAPLDSLTEKTEKGVLPITGSDGTLPWKYYARPFEKTKTPIVAIIFTNLGLSKPMAEKATSLPHDITLAFSPYAGDMGKWAAKARSEGYESLADLPMQAENFPLSDPGQFGLMEDLSPDENIDRMHGILMRFPAFIGMVAPVDEKMTANKDGIRPYLLELKKRGLLFIYTKNDKNSGIADVIKADGIYALAIDKVVDEEPSRNAVDAQFQSLVEIAKTKGYAIGLAHAYPSTIESLQAWMDTLKNQGVDLAPLSAVGKRVYP